MEKQKLLPVKKLRKQNLGQIPQEASPNLNAPENAPSR